MIENENKENNESFLTWVFYNILLDTISSWVFLFIHVFALGWIISVPGWWKLIMIITIVLYWAEQLARYKAQKKK